MKFIDLTTKYAISKERLRSILAVAGIIAVCAIVVLCIRSMLNAQTENELDRRNEEAVSLQEEAEAASSATSEESSATSMSETIEETLLAPSLASDTETSAESSLTESETTTTTTAETTKETVFEGIYEDEYYLTVYASQSLNLRVGPGTDFDLVRTLDYGDQIDVIALTSNGWYKTYNGNYVDSTYTQTEPIATAAATTTTTATTAQQTTAATTTTAYQAPQEEPSSGDTSGMTYYGSCTITFYGPQPLSDGSYSTTTATGTTCSEGRTCAADWGVFPSGTVIYIPDDPLGGDGYYTVEDTGPGVSGAHVDIFTNGSYSTTSRDVYIVN